MDSIDPLIVPRVHILKFGTEEDPQRYIVESSNLHVILPGASAMIGSDWKNENDGNPHTNISTSVHREVFDALPYPVEEEFGNMCKEIRFGNGLTIRVVIDPFAGLNDDEAYVLAKLMEEDEPEISDHDLKIVESIMAEPVVDPIRL